MRGKLRPGAAENALRFGHQLRPGNARVTKIKKQSVAVAGRVRRSSMQEQFLEVSLVGARPIPRRFELQRLRRTRAWVVRQRVRPNPSFKRTGLRPAA